MKTAWMFQTSVNLFYRTPLFVGFLVLLTASLHAQTPVLVKDINPSGDSYPNLMVAYNGRLIFQADDGSHGTELWISDGTETGTTMVKDINSGGNSSNPKDFTLFNGKMFFVANGTQLWQTDGTETGTAQVTAVTISSLVATGIMGDALYFYGSDGSAGFELWKTDGTEEGTVLVKDINPSGNGNISGFMELNGIMYFTANDGTSGVELWRSDGTDEGTTQVTDINPGSVSSFPRNLTVMNGQIFFSANDGVNGFELWKTDGTEEGTVLVKDTATVDFGGSPVFIKLIAGRLYFLATLEANNAEPWVSDGTEAGTFQLAETQPGTQGGYGDPEFTLLNGIVLFKGADQELWRTDGTQAGTVRVKDINPEGNSSPYELTLLGNYVYFAADDGTHGGELWRSDGTEAGTTLVYDTLPGSGYGDAYPIVRVGGSLFYGATGATGGNELYMLEGGGLLDASSLSYSDGQFQITVEGVSGQYLEVEGTDDFSTWSYIDSGLVTDGKLTVTDTDAGSHPNRSYRAKVAIPL